MSFLDTMTLWVAIVPRHNSIAAYCSRVGQLAQALRMRRRRDRAAVRQVGRLPVPAAERQVIAFDEIEQLRDGVRPVARVQQRIRERVGVRAIARPRSSAASGWCGGSAEHGDEIVDLRSDVPTPSLRQ